MITDEDTRYVLEIVGSICSEVGPGVPGSAQERQRAAAIGRELAAHLGPERVVTEEFMLAPGAFVGAMPVGALLTLLAVLLNLATGRSAGVAPAPLITSGGALVLSIVALVPFVFEFVLSRELIDPLFRKGTSVNVIGTLRRSGTDQPKRVLIMSGHHDSAPENTWLRLLGYGFFVAVVTMSLGSIVLVAMSALQVTGVVTGNPGMARAGTLGWVPLIYPIGPAILLGAFFTWRGRGGGTVPGAVDNLSACGLVVALCRILVRHPALIPAGTEIRFISFGGEEAGLRGSRRYVARHLEELRRLDARVLNIETVAHPEVVILRSDVNGTVPNSATMVASVVAAAERAGVPYKVAPASLGTATDAGPFSRAGLRATTLLPFKVPQQMVAFYHQRRDGPEILRLEPLSHVLRVALEWVRSGGE